MNDFFDVIASYHWYDIFCFLGLTVFAVLAGATMRLSATVFVEKRNALVAWFVFVAMMIFIGGAVVCAIPFSLYPNTTIQMLTAIWFFICFLFGLYIKL